MKYLISTTAKVLASILMAIIIYVLIDTKRQLEHYIYTIVAAICVSAIIGILQFFDIPLTWSIRELQGEVLLKPEPAGLAPFSLLFSYHLALAIPLVFSLSINEKIVPKKTDIFDCFIIAYIRFAYYASSVSYYWFYDRSIICYFNQQEL